MNAIPFDTLEFANRLKSVGFSEEQAQVITELQRTATGNTLEQAKHEYHFDEAATKRDLKEMETALEHKIELLKAETYQRIAETNQRIAECKADLTRWIIGAGFLQTTLIIGVLLKVAHLI
ncbi:MAG: CCDC90 family protein [Methylococcaceae bacterium]|nr:CCDC90 family protein [Methylococcaceae bacterium]